MTTLQRTGSNNAIRFTSLGVLVTIRRRLTSFAITSRQAYVVQSRIVERPCQGL
jgi:hypothetical protein